MAVAGKTGRGAAALSAGAAGLKAGAKTFGIPGAIAGGVFGAAGGAIFGGSELGAMNEEELAELKRRQEMGALGYTDEEYGALRGEMSGQVGQQFAQQQALQAGLTATQGMGSGITAKTDSLRVGENIKAQQDMERQVRMANQKEIANEEARMAQLGESLDKAAQERQEDVFKSVLSMADTAGDLGIGADENALAYEKLQADIQMAETLKSLGIDLEGNDLQTIIQNSMAAARG